MIRDLPAPHEYYRPARARELRRKAARLRWLRDAWPFALLLAFGALVPATIRYNAPLFAAFALTLLVVAPALAWWCERLSRRIAALREEAERLDREHQARHGDRLRGPAWCAPAASSPDAGAQKDSPFANPRSLAVLALVAAGYDMRLFTALAVGLGVVGPALCWWLAQYARLCRTCDGLDLLGSTTSRAAADPGRRKWVPTWALPVLALVGLLGVSNLMAPPFGPQRSKQANVAAALTQIASFESALALYIRDHGQPPTTRQGLDALIERPASAARPGSWKGPYIGDVTSLPRDPWGNDYHYEAPGPNGHPYVIISYGEDGRKGGAGYAFDLSSAVGRR